MLDVIVKSHKGDILGQVFDKNNYLMNLFDQFSDDYNIRKLKNIDPYGDTTFNDYTVFKICIGDIQYIKTNVDSTDERIILECLEQLFKIALDNKHSSVRFLGD